MHIRELQKFPDEMAMHRAQLRDFSHRPRKFQYLPFGEENMDKAKAAAAARARLSAEILRRVAASKAKQPTNPAKKSAPAKKAVAKKRDGKYDRNAKFVCEKGCGKTITGPWSYKQHLIKQHGYTPEQAGLNPRSKSKKK